MKHTLLLGGLLAAFITTGAMAKPSPWDQTPSPTVVYGDLVTVGGGTDNCLFQADATR